MSRFGRRWFLYRSLDCNNNESIFYRRIPEGANLNRNPTPTPVHVEQESYWTKLNKNQLFNTVMALLALYLSLTNLLYLIFLLAILFEEFLSYRRRRRVLNELKLWGQVSAAMFQRIAEMRRNDEEAYLLRNLNLRNDSDSDYEDENIEEDVFEDAIECPCGSCKF